MQSWSRNPSLLKNTPIFCLGTTRFTASEAQQTGIHMVTKVLKAGAADVVGAHVEPMWFHRLEKKKTAVLQVIELIMLSRLVYVYVVLHIYSRIYNHIYY